jgi:hypothetical protein
MGPLSAGRLPGCCRSTRRGACFSCTAGTRTIPSGPSGSRSETRISVDPARLGEPVAEQAIEFSWGGHHILQDQVFYAVLVTSAEALGVSLEGLDQWEQATTDTYGWLAAGDLEADERPAHPDIPDLIRAAVARLRRE